MAATPSGLASITGFHPIVADGSAGGREPIRLHRFDGQLSLRLQKQRRKPSSNQLPGRQPVQTQSDGATAPVVTTQPVSLTVAAGQSATFSVAVTGTIPLSYQWNRNGAAISGAMSASYTTAATTNADNGAVFSVVVSNSAGSATSNDATLTVNAPHRR